VDVESLYRPEGHRLGIAVVGTPPAACEDAFERALRAHGLSPQRRLARIGPRLGEDDVRADDVVDFLARYGHEYALLFVAVGAPDPEALAAGARSSGCEAIVDG
jgi:hypothetical protein